LVASHIAKPFINAASLDNPHSILEEE